MTLRILNEKQRDFVSDVLSRYNVLVLEINDGTVHVDDFVPYDLRHTYCTDLARAGVDIRTAQKLMGHANISVTADNRLSLTVISFLK